MRTRVSVLRGWQGVATTPYARALPGSRTPNELELSFQAFSGSKTTFDSGEGVATTPCHPLGGRRTNGNHK